MKRRRNPDKSLRTLEKLAASSNATAEDFRQYRAALVRAGKIRTITLEEAVVGFLALRNISDPPRDLENFFLHIGWGAAAVDKNIFRYWGQWTEDWTLSTDLVTHNMLGLQWAGIVAGLMADFSEERYLRIIELPWSEMSQFAVGKTTFAAWDPDLRVVLVMDY